MSKRSSRNIAESDEYFVASGAMRLTASIALSEGSAIAHNRARSAQRAIAAAWLAAIFPAPTIPTRSIELLTALVDATVVVPDPVPGPAPLCGAIVPLVTLW